MENLQNRKLKMILLIAFVLVVSVGIAYAALSATLTITFGNVVQNKLTWNVAFDTTSTTVTPTLVGSSATGRSCGNATVAADSVTVANTTLSKPGDACIYKLTIKNSGDIDASLASVVPTAPTSTTCTPTSASASASAKLVCGNITYQLVKTASPNNTTYAITTTNLTTGTALAKATSSTSPTTMDTYLVVQYTGSSLASTATTQTGAKFTLTFNQV